MDAKSGLMLKMVLNMTPPISKETKAIIANLHFDISKMMLGLLSTYRESLKNTSPELYELVLRITTQLIYTYETNPQFREKLNREVIPLIIAFAREYESKKTN